MGSYARHQERLRVARERMAIRKKVDLGKEVLTGKLRQKRLYNFTDEPAVEERIDQILSILVRKELQLTAAEKSLRRSQDSVSILAFFRALSAVRDLEKEARGKLITELKDVSSRLKNLLATEDEKRAQIEFFVERLNSSNKRIEELKTLLVKSSASNEIQKEMALDLCAIKAVEQGYTQIELDDVKAAFRQEMDEHKETRRVLKETTEHLNEKTSKYEALQQHYIEQVALDNAEEYAAFMYYGLATAEAKRLEEDLLDSLKRYERARLTIDRVEMEAAEEIFQRFGGQWQAGPEQGTVEGKQPKKQPEVQQEGEKQERKEQIEERQGGKVQEREERWRHKVSRKEGEREEGGGEEEEVDGDGPTTGRRRRAPVTIHPQSHRRTRPR